MKANEVNTNADLVTFLNSFATPKERGDFMREADNEMIDKFIHLSSCIATKMWLSHYKKQAEEDSSQIKEI